jgi:hypothetical protein
MMSEIGSSPPGTKVGALSDDFDASKLQGSGESKSSFKFRPQGDATETSSNAGITLSAAQQASLTQARLPGSPDVSPSQNQGRKELQPIGTLNVGDRFASIRQNSPETSQAASQGISGIATMPLTVPGTSSASPSNLNSPSPSVDSKSLSKSYGSSSINFFRDWYNGTDDEEEKKKRHYIVGGFSERSSTGSFTPTGTSPSSPTTEIAPETQRYIFNVHDVHDMGGTPSRLSILDAQSGNSLGSYNLPAGNSTFTADLPPGNYTIEAQSGSRSGNAPNAGHDDLDNFRVDVSSAGPTPTGSGGSGGGGGSAPSK